MFEITAPGLRVDDLDPRIARSRENIVNAATQILLESGVRAVTVDAVSERSGVAKSTLYRHWSSRADLLVEVVRCNMPEAHGDLPPGDFETCLRAVMGEIAASMSSNEWAQLIPAMMTMSRTVPEVLEMQERDRDERLAMLQSLLDRGVDEGVLRPGITAATAMPLLVGPVFIEALSGLGADLGALATAAVDQFMAAHGAPRR